MNYHIFYVVNGCSKIEVLPTMRKVDRFIKDFILKYGSIDDGDSNWIEYVYEGKLIDILPSYNLKERKNESTTNR